MINEELITDVARRHDFVLLFDVTDGNPNGDPDAGNLPRTDPETNQGLVTDVALKRKVRDWIDMGYGKQERLKIYVQHGAYLTDTRNRIFGSHSEGGKSGSINEGRTWMCEEFFDVRMFGAVMSMKEANAGQVRGPIQLTFARSIDPIAPMDITIVGPAQNASQSKRAEGDESDKFGTMGRKSFVPYGLYRAHGFFNPHFARQTGVTAEDMTLFWQALELMWDVDRSASRGFMASRGLYIFSHTSALGDAPAHRLLERITVERRTEVAVPRSFNDYQIKINEEDMPEKVSLTKLVHG
ncbi:type I-C CRISPR-associated protein Cas7/Csd2 [Candidatus Chloroploca asiatica]|uniref:Type I-C CRISPR-associated protein Cas7/Csd2 n=1 Tax=Candidatus Chloroploca asiatica TaxID=1506545 RepID=A0A2H3KGR3_9CHLR|nr:type I-C CRISPR-associated protein Cas7/Csd2 [Candidatus Chloroploca asiatica]PDV96935.1 type I-C CRISPR-associated protein Cas7/Csd2 [Candidatus Chloroploca asiatica]